MKSNVIPFPQLRVTRQIAVSPPFAIWQLWLGMGWLMFAAFCAPRRR